MLHNIHHHFLHDMYLNNLHNIIQRNNLYFLDNILRKKYEITSTKNPKFSRSARVFFCAENGANVMPMGPPSCAKTPVFIVCTGSECFLLLSNVEEKKRKHIILKNIITHEKCLTHNSWWSSCTWKKCSVNNSGV